VPHWPLLCERILHGNRSIPVTFIAFNVLRVDGHDVDATLERGARNRRLLDETASHSDAMSASHPTEGCMNSRSMAGWIGFAGILMVLLGCLSFFQGLIALLEDNYYVPTQSGYLLFDITGWGWIMLIWGVILALVGLALLNGASWARWVSILLVSINVFSQLGFLGNTNDQVWLLITLTFNIIVLYALIVRWHESERELQTR
jgi:magnesium-transporting ATPase (P-type)